MGEGGEETEALEPAVKRSQPLASLPHGKLGSAAVAAVARRRTDVQRDVRHIVVLVWQHDAGSVLGPHAIACSAVGEGRACGQRAGRLTGHRQLQLPAASCRPCSVAHNQATHRAICSLEGKESGQLRPAVQGPAAHLPAPRLAGFPG